MILIPLNLASEGQHKFGEEDDQFLIASFNKLPKNITAENIPKRMNRVFLLQVTDDVNNRTSKSYDIIDILLRLQYLRKRGDLSTPRGTEVNLS